MKTVTADLIIDDPDSMVLMAGELAQITARIRSLRDRAQILQSLLASAMAKARITEVTTDDGTLVVLTVDVKG